MRPQSHSTRPPQNRKTRHAPSLRLEELEPRNLLSGSPTPVGFIPSQIAKAYGINQIRFNGGTIVGDGTGQTIAIVDAYDNPNIRDDLEAFDARFGLPAPPIFSIVAQDGSYNLPGVDPNPPGTNNWEGEEALAVEWAHAIAPRANLLLVEANDSHWNNLVTAVDVAREEEEVTVVSMSFTAANLSGRPTEFSGENSYDSIFTTLPGHAGMTFVGATGDYAAPGGYPAYSPNVLAAGGTSLTLDRSNNYLSESGWSHGGGGRSLYELQPSYQQLVVPASMSMDDGIAYRTIPDVAFDAAPNTGVAVYDSYNNGSSAPWVKVGGTSLSAPAWAALIAIADQGRAIHGLGSLDGVGETLPKLYNMVIDAFHDITTGNNGYQAVPGYDLVTGRGTPKANQLVPLLAGGPNYGPGVYDPNTGNWYLRDEDSGGSPDIPVFQYGGFGQPVTGDWDGNGSTTVGIYASNTGMWYLNNVNGHNSNPITFQFGYSGTIAVTGDWIGDGITRAGIYDPNTGTWYLDHYQYQGDRDPIVFQFGFGGAIPVTGKFFGDGITHVGVYYPPTGTWYLNNVHGPNPTPTTFQFGFGGTIPVTGDWYGDGTTRVGVYYPGAQGGPRWYLDHNILMGDDSPINFQYGYGSVIPVTGSWNYTTASTPGSSGAPGGGAGASSSGSGQPAAFFVLSSVPEVSVPGQLGAAISAAVVPPDYREPRPEPLPLETLDRVATTPAQVVDHLFAARAGRTRAEVLMDDLALAWSA
jgi:hypothetical protein